MAVFADISSFLRTFWEVWVMVFFVTVVWWAFRPGNKARFEEDAQIPFREDATPEES